MNLAAQRWKISLLAVAVTLFGCGGGTPPPPPPAATYHISGTVSGLPSGEAVVLQVNGGATFTASLNGTYTLASSVPAGTVYSVKVKTQPATAVCAVTDGSGTVGTSDVSNIAVTCVASYSVGGSVTGLLANNSILLTDNGDDSKTITQNGSYVFSQSLPSGTPYSVVITTAPAGQSCSAANASGTVLSNDVTNVAITCSANQYNITVSVAGLVAGTTLGLSDGAGPPLNVTSNGDHNFSATVPSGTAYNVSVTSQPVGESCTAASGSGTVVAANVAVNITCVPQPFTIGGTLTGLSAGGLVLQDNLANNLAVSSGASSFVFSNPVASGQPYSVSVLTDPTGETCTTASASGTVMGSNVTSVAISCSTNSAPPPAGYNVSATVTGLVGSLDLQDNGGDDLNVTANGTFTFATAVASGSTYAVTVHTAPTNQSCVVTNGSGTIASSNVTATVSCTANTGEWAWVGGPNTLNGAAVYGTLGVAAAGNTPGSRIGAVSWTDASGNFWLFGGNPNYGGGNSSYLNDLWKFSPVSGLWTWMSGSNTADAGAIYGTQGVAAAGNVPSARQSSTSWADSSGNLWLFGGSGCFIDPDVSTTVCYGGLALDDLWKYSIATNEWTFVTGHDNNIFDDRAGVYGTLGVPSAGNNPGGRYSAQGWVGSTGLLYMFGGNAVSSDENAQGVDNDFWVFSPSTGLWEWIGGPTSIFVAANYGSFGTQGVASSSNFPSARDSAQTWTDQNGNFRMFGGLGDGSSGVGVLNDVWTYNQTSGNWTWVKGSSTPNASGVYGTKGSASSTTTPGSRFESVGWSDGAGNLYLFGGTQTGYPGDEDFNDFWKYSISANQWTWLGGAATTNVAGTYGTEGVPATANIPGSRYLMTAWTDSSGNFWLFGGQGFATVDPPEGLLDDMWKYVP